MINSCKKKNSDINCLDIRRKLECLSVYMYLYYVVILLLISSNTDSDIQVFAFLLKCLLFAHCESLNGKNKISN